jgi:hypothetical protein
VAALHLACKLLETSHPEINDYVRVSDGACSAQEICLMERELLGAVDADVGVCTTSNALDECLAPLTTTGRSIACYLADLTLIDHASARFTPQEIACTCAAVGAGVRVPHSLCAVHVRALHEQARCNPADKGIEDVLRKHRGWMVLEGFPTLRRKV